MKDGEFIKNIKLKLDRPVVLVGMMGSGKSHLGQQLALELGVRFYDSDTIIEKKAGCAIAEIFSRDGEPKFREVEKNTILELLGGGPCVVATGGGAVMNPETMEEIKKRAVSIWLCAGIETLLARTAKNANRPLLKESSPETVLRELLAKREAIYAKADMRIDSSDSAQAQSVPAMIKSLSDFLNTANLCSP